MSRPSPQTERLIDLVDLLASRPTEGYTLAGIARAAGLSKATVHPMVVALTKRGWLLRHPESRTYRLGPGLVAAGRAAAKGDTTLAAARPVVRELAATTGLTAVALVTGGMPGEDDDLLVGEIGTPPHLARATPRERHWSAYRGLRLGDRITPRPPLGAVGIAWADGPEIERWLDRLGPDRTPTTATELAPALAGIRARGWALEIEHHHVERLGTLADELDADHRHAEHAAVLRQVLVDIGKEYDVTDTLPVEIVPTARYRASVVNAPVFDPQGRVALILCLLCGIGGQAAPVRTGAEIQALGERLRRAAAVIARTSGAAAFA